jgi:hypothetical protein
MIKIKKPKGYEWVYLHTLGMKKGPNKETNKKPPTQKEEILKE